ncbi:hypothetical protein OG373_41130 [Streptomyces avidinii]|uniref:hypothetical protein n=1 Tax=Streptomyces avidinii TaxID=1895 RepID=UPI003866CADC|nr:hypothetical protein OG373_00045 [Streptomyces avidinii]WTB02255.1 hypothetical protein OG373_41130 [Streptomyces avidinii]
MNEAVALYPHSEPQQVAHVRDVAMQNLEPWAEQFNHGNALDLVRSVANAQDYMRDWPTTPPPVPTDPPPGGGSGGGIGLGGLIPPQTGGKYPWATGGGSTAGAGATIHDPTGGTEAEGPDLLRIAAALEQLAVRDHAQAEQYGEQKKVSDRQYRAAVKSGHVASATGKLMKALAPVAEDHPDARSYRDLMRLGGITFGEYNLSVAAVDDCLRRANQSASA